MSFPELYVPPVAGQHGEATQAEEGQPDAPQADPLELHGEMESKGVVNGGHR